MNRSRYIQQNVVKRFTDQQTASFSVSRLCVEDAEYHPDFMRQFLVMAQNRRRQILERMLME